MKLFRKTVPIVSHVLAVLCIASLWAATVQAQEGPAAGDRDQVVTAETPTTAHSGYGVMFLPPGHLYDKYTADPRRIDFGLQVLDYSKTEIPQTGSTRFDLKTGGEFGLVRVHPRGQEDLGWELGLAGAVDSQFDIDGHLDNIGWDGWYSLLLTTAQTRNLSLKFGWVHDSSHVGDEYAQRTGRQRIGYTRQELVAGVSWLADSGLRTYAEYGWGKLLGNYDLQKPGRVQFGLEWLPARPVPAGYRGWYAASDFSAMQERDWKVDTSLQTGYRIDSGGKTWRFGVDWYKGRPPIGEFFQYTETYLGLGVWVDI